MANDLVVEKHGRVTVATLNRPARHNALTISLAAELEAAVAEFSSDDEQRVFILTGAGQNAFCSGADLLETRTNATVGTSLPMAPEQDISGLERCEKPMIAAINGLAIGGGLEMALCCDFRLAADTAWFALPEVERGFIAGLAAVTLPRLMPIGAVLQLMLLGERMSASDAHRLGLVQQVLPAEDLMTEAMRQAERISRLSPAALWGTKKVIRAWRNHALAEQHQHYSEVIEQVFQSGQFREGLQAFAEKRAPNYSGSWPGRR